MSEASSVVADLNLFEQPHLIETRDEVTDLSVKEDVNGEVEKAKERELEIEKNEMKRNKIEVKVNEEVKWKDQEFPFLDVTSLGASLTSLRRFLHHARRLRCGPLTHCLFCCLSNSLVYGT